MGQKIETIVSPESSFFERLGSLVDIGSEVTIVYSGVNAVYKAATKVAVGEVVSYGTLSNSVDDMVNSLDDVANVADDAAKMADDAWDMAIGGKTINDRWYTEHALERMAPDTIQVRAELEARAIQKGCMPGTQKFIDYVDSRGVPPMVVEDAIQNGI